MRLLLSLCYVVLFIPSLCFAFGGVVTDPGSYSYYATQIEKAVEQVKFAEEQVKQATQTYQKVVNVDKSLTGNVSRAQESLSRIKSLQDMSIYDVRKSMNYTKRALSEISDLANYQDDISKEIDKTFGLENQKRGDWVNVEAEKRANKQMALKRAVIDAETAQGMMKIQDEQLEDLALATNETADLKDATDVTNTALLQMIEGQNTMIRLLANISKNLALAEYNGGEHGSTNKKMVNGKDLTQKEDWKIKNNKKPSQGDCNPFTDNCSQGINLFEDM